MFAFIGKLVTQMREEHSLSIEDLASRSGVSIEKLTEIEAGKITPSVGVLLKIARALGSRLGTLLDGQESRSAVVCRARSTFENGAVSSTGAKCDGYQFFPLAQGKLDRNMEPFLIEIAADSAKEASVSEHEGEEFLYVLEGSIDINYGAETYRLERGDSIYYDSVVPHTLTNTSTTQVAKILATVYTPF